MVSLLSVPLGSCKSKYTVCGPNTVYSSVVVGLPGTVPAQAMGSDENEVGEPVRLAICGALEADETAGTCGSPVVMAERSCSVGRKRMASSVKTTRAAAMSIPRLTNTGRSGKGL